MSAISEAGDLSSLEARLMARFSQLDPDEVRRCVDDSVAQFEAARVRTYLAVLIERAAIDRLRAVESARGEVGASYGAESRPSSNRWVPEGPNRPLHTHRLAGAG